jgi:hypothetical protein
MMSSGDSRAYNGNASRHLFTPRLSLSDTVFLVLRGLHRDPQSNHPLFDTRKLTSSLTTLWKYQGERNCRRLHSGRLHRIEMS